MHRMDLKFGPNSYEYARNAEDNNRIFADEKKPAKKTREARIRHRQRQKDAEDIVSWSFKTSEAFFAKLSFHNDPARSLAVNSNAPFSEGSPVMTSQWRIF
ncbi:hypothetical protein WA026_014643 [Henosepilachna vigintioctopunctata]|uniref:Uncharacterized protein n=1 Tax=Henosepilachna vigintioctopunctata TaxID=420089 RepID=A0AAW1VCN2_9CUCU